MGRQTFYEPTTGGYERVITERLRHWQRLRDAPDTPSKPESRDSQ
ncbi:hypothetical protein [Curtobacterium sp. MCPF17_046]